MNDLASRYHGDRFPPEINSHAVWLYYRFSLSFRDVEDLLAQRGIVVSYETICQWCEKFGPDYAAKLKRRRGGLGDTWFLDEVFVTIRGKRQDLWRAVDQDGDLIDLLVQPRRNRRAAEKLFRKLLKGEGCEPRQIMTDEEYADDGPYPSRLMLGYLRKRPIHVVAIEAPRARFGWSMVAHWWVTGPSRDRCFAPAFPLGYRPSLDGRVREG